MRSTARVVSPCSVVAACTVEPSSNTSNQVITASTTVATTGPGVTTADDDTTMASAGADSSSAGSGANSTTGGKLDVGSVSAGCNAIDILFVVDNSASMNTYQAALTAAFPSFIDALWESLPPDTSVHLGVTTTDFGSPGCINATESTNNCQSTASASDITMHYDTPVNAPTEVNGSQGRLFRWDDRNFFEANTNGDSAELVTWFSGAATAAGENGCTF